MEHTKGPWKLMPCSNGGMLLIRGDEKAPVSERHIQSHIQILPVADAYLIAAAPDLLFALKVALWRLKAARDFPPSGVEPGKDLLEAIARAENAIKRANGEGEKDHDGNRAEGAGLA